MIGETGRLLLLPVALMAAACSGTQPPPSPQGVAWDVEEAEPDVGPSPPDVIFWDETMTVESAPGVEGRWGDCVDWPLKLLDTLDRGPLRTTGALWDEEYLWISPGGPFAQPTRHFFKCVRKIQNGVNVGWRKWDIGEFQFKCSSSSIRIAVKSTYPPKIDGFRYYEEFPLPAKYRNAVPICSRFVLTVLTPDGERHEVPYSFSGGGTPPGVPVTDECWESHAHHMSAARDEQRNPTGEECVVPSN